MVSGIGGQSFGIHILVNTFLFLIALFHNVLDISAEVFFSSTEIGLTTELARAINEELLISLVKHF